jgi:hypothetical protein
MARNWANNGYSTLAGAIGTSDTSISVQSGHGDRFPAAGSGDIFHITLQDASNNIEIVRVTSRTLGSDTMTIVRAQEATTAKSWAIGDIVEHRLTAEAIREFTPKDSPAFTGVPTAPTADPGTDTTQLATTAFVTGAVTLTNLGITATAAELNIMDGVTATTAELNLLDGATLDLAAVTATAAEINLLDGVTGVGKILQVVEGVKESTTSTSSTSPIDLSLNASITPSSESNKILIFAVVNGYSLRPSEDDAAFSLQLLRTSTSLWTKSASSRSANVVDEVVNCDLSFMYLDSPATTSSTTYNVYGAAGGGCTADFYAGARIILMEVAA